MMRTQLSQWWQFRTGLAGGKQGPLRAATVWHLLDANVRNSIGHDTTRFVAPRYLRLAMGGSHSVYILMRINLEHVGRALFNHVNRFSNCSMDSKPEADSFKVVELPDGESHLCDDDWARRQTVRRSGSAGASGYTVDQWCEAVRAAMRSEGRTFVVMHFFSGERRTGDVHQWVEEACQSNGWQLLMISVDLACDAAWDYTNPTTFTKIMSLVEEGLIDVVIGGPPCSTVARSRHVWCPGGPRPLRYRNCLWGRPDLRPGEKVRVHEANTLWVNFMATCEGVSARGGAHLWEHPADPGEEPYASVWATDEMQGVEFRTGAVRAVLHQCPYGGLVPKLTCLSGTLYGLDKLDGVRCPGVSATHQHGKSIGRNPEGGFYTRRLQTYPVLFCKELARLVINTLQVMWQFGSGPTGAIHVDVAESAPRVTHWSTWSDQHRQGVVLLNEASARRTNVNINKDQAATYVHVDDTVFVSAQPQDRLHADSLLGVTVEALERLGFTVSQQSRSGELTKVVGYELIQSPAIFRLPVNKMVLLRLALLELADRRWVQVRTLRSVVGVWIFGALLCRDLLSIPHSIFQFMTEYEDSLAEWWPSARREARMMARVTGLMQCHVGSAILPWLFATDAMGANEVDNGGFGMVVTKISKTEVQALLRVGEMEGRSIARVDGSGGAKYPQRALKPTVPFTLLPEEFFDPGRWFVVDSGRWKFAEHITLGESRTVVKLLERLASQSLCHGQAVFSLQDNRPTACSMAKGRSPSYGLNRLLRRKAALCLATGIRLFLPWVESSRQPADESSRHV